MNPTNLPAGLIDNNIEFFEANGTAFVLQDGKVTPYAESRTGRSAIQLDMMKHVELIGKLSKEFDVHGIELEEKWVICRYGGFNNVPDFNSTTSDFKPEYKECPNRGKCSLSGCICSIPANLTHQELNAVKAIVTGEPAKVAAERMGIKFNTIRAYLKSVHVKLNVHSRADVVNFAHNNNIL